MDTEASDFSMRTPLLHYMGYTYVSLVHTKYPVHSHPPVPAPCNTPYLLMGKVTLHCHHMIHNHHQQA